MITKSLKLNFETRVPANTQDDDLSVEMSSLEQCFDRTGRLHSVIIPDHGLFAPEPIGPGNGPIDTVWRRCGQKSGS
jgi:hypothetical protein